LQVLVNFINNAIKFTPTGGLVTILLEVVDAQDLQDKKQLDQIIEEEVDQSMPELVVPDKEVINSESEE